MASSAVADNFVSREDAKKQKQMQEARQAGTAAPEMDEATGQMINPHNPSFITQAPWYLNQDKPSLKHHRAWNLKAAGTKDWYQRGTKGDVKTKFLKGACENCGATTHTKKDCTERPRQVGAKWNGKNLMPDEYIEDLNLDWDGKRDRWNGFQAEDYKEIMEEWEKVEQERRNRKAAAMEERAKLRERLKAQKKQLKQQRKQRRRQLRRQAEGKDLDSDTGDSDVDSDTDSDTDSDSEASDDEDLGEKMRDFDKSTAAVSTKDDKLRTTTRNLRIREDTAKYLLNLDVNSAFYDPKSRSMRDDPFKHLKDEEKGVFRGDNFLASSGDTKKLTELMVFAWDAYKHGEKVHDTAQPTQASKMFEVFKQRSDDLKTKQKEELMAKYGGQEHLDAPKELIYGQTDSYVEYSRDGRVLKGRERQYVKSKYEEDVLVGNHSSIWGSWFDPVTKMWGFACCRQTMKNAYCIPKFVKTGAGEDGDDAAAVADAGDAAAAAVEDGEAAAAAGEGAGEGAAAGGTEGGDGSSSSSSSDSSAGEEDGKTAEEKRLAIAEKRRARALQGLKVQQQAGAAGAASSAAAASSSSSSAATADMPPKMADHRKRAADDADSMDNRVLQQVVEREKKRRKEQTGSKAFSIDDERNRKYGFVSGERASGEVSPEEFEAYRLARARSDDPMAKFT